MIISKKIQFYLSKDCNNNLERVLQELRCKRLLNRTSCHCPSPNFNADLEYNQYISSMKSAQFRSTLSEWENKLNEIRLVKQKADFLDFLSKSQPQPPPEPMFYHNCHIQQRPVFISEKIALINELLKGSVTINLDDINEVLKGPKSEDAQFKTLVSALAEKVALCDKLQKEDDDRKAAELKELTEKAARLDMMEQAARQEEASKLFHAEEAAKEAMAEKARQFEAVEKELEKKRILDEFVAGQVEQEKSKQASACACNASERVFCYPAVASAHVPVGNAFHQSRDCRYPFLYGSRYSDVSVYDKI